jgi:site-specific recombinase XerD
MMRSPTFRSALADRFSQYIEFRRQGGVDSHSQTQLLRFFDRFLHEEGFQGRWPNRGVIERYVATSSGLNPGTRVNRFSVIRQFCRFLRQFESHCYVPEHMLPLERRPARVPHIYAEGEIRAILAASRNLEPRDSLRPKTYSTLFGLLYTTGLRCGEAFDLNLDDVDLHRKLLWVRKGKFGKSRCVPISPSTSVALQEYFQQRARMASAAAELALFLTSTGRRVYHTNADFAFRQVLTRCGLRGGRGCPGPRMHDLRHSFACTRLLKWYRQGKDVQALLPALATYLGHVKVSSTQVYLQSTAELLEHVNKRFHKNFIENVLKKGEQR